MRRRAPTTRIYPKVLAVTAAVAVTSACSFKGGAPDVLSIPMVGQAHWKIEPIDMRVYPSTRFVRGPEQGVLEVRIELFDEMGDSVKAVGRIHIELYATRRRDRPSLDRRLYAWEASLLTLEKQLRYYDPITRTYMFPLSLDSLSVARDATMLRVTFVLPDGRRLEAQRSLPDIHTPPPPPPPADNSK